MQHYSCITYCKIGLDEANSDSMDVLPTGEGVLIIDEVKVIFEVILTVNRKLRIMFCRIHKVFYHFQVMQIKFTLIVRRLVGGWCGVAGVRNLLACV